MKLVKNKIDGEIKKLVDPKLRPSEQRIEDVIDIRSTIKGLNWLSEQVEEIKKKQD